jgi:hypothetical protein
MPTLPKSWPPKSHLPGAGEIQWKVWLAKTAAGLDITISGVAMQVNRGKIKVPKRRIVNTRLIYVKDGQAL